MKVKILLIALFLLAPAALFSAWVDADNSGQAEVDMSNDPSYISYVPSIAVDSKGHAHIAWYSVTPAGNLQIYYLYWDGIRWVDAAGSAGQEGKNISNTTYDAQYPRLVLDSHDNPNITWEDGPDDDRMIYYSRWNGTAWVTAAGAPGYDVLNAPDYSGHPAIALDSSDRPHIAWMNEMSSNPDLSDIYYAQWNGTAWTAADGGAYGNIYDSGYYGAWPNICIDSAGLPHITWMDGPDDNTDIYYLKYNGTAWVDATGSGQANINISNTPDYSSWPSLALDSGDNPHIVFEDDDEGGQNIYYLHWNGSAWVDVTGSGTAAISVSQTYDFCTVPTIKLDKNNVPHVIWSEGAEETCDIMSVKWNGTSWSDETGSGTAFKDIYPDILNSEWASMALDANGNPHIAWSDGVILQQHDIYYLHWQPEGTPTVTPTVNFSITTTPMPTLTATNTITPTMTITMTITDTPVMPAMIHPNACWADASGSGAVNDPVSLGTKPVLKLDSAGRPNICWQYGGSIYFMKYNGYQWVNASGSALGNFKISGDVFTCDSPDMVLDSQDRPHVAWMGFFTDWTMAYYIWWNGSSWADVNGNTNLLMMSVPVVEGGYAGNVSLAIDSMQKPGLAWADYPQNLTWTVKDIFYFKWNGSDWVDATGAGRNNGAATDHSQDCENPSLVFDASGAPHIAYTYGGSMIRYLYWKNSTWVDAAGSGITGAINAITYIGATASGTARLALGNSSFPSIAFPCEVGYVFYPCFVKWNGAAWQDMAGDTNEEQLNLYVSPGNVRETDMVLDSSGNPCIAAEADGGIYYARWKNGSGWVTAHGDPAALDPNPPLLKTTSGNKISLACDIAGNPNIAWEDTSADYFLRYICGQLSPTPTITATPTGTMTPTATPPYTATPTPTATHAPVLVKIEKNASGTMDPSELIYTININNDPNNPVYNITMWDTLPLELEFDSSITGPSPVVNGNYLFFDWGGGIIEPGQALTVSFSVRIRNLKPDMLFANIAATDYNDDYYSVTRHPVVFSNQCFYPQGVTAVYPNPFNPNTAIGGNLKFVNMPDNSAVSIYTLSGEYIGTYNSSGGAAYWNGKNSLGRAVSAGIYYYVVVNPAKQGSYYTKGKIFVIYK
jgi:hypothetical protein